MEGIRKQAELAIIADGVGKAMLRMVSCDVWVREGDQERDGTCTLISVSERFPSQPRPASAPYLHTNHKRDRL